MTTRAVVTGLLPIAAVEAGCAVSRRITVTLPRICRSSAETCVEGGARRLSLERKP